MTHDPTMTVIIVLYSNFVMQVLTRKNQVFDTRSTTNIQVSITDRTVPMAQTGSAIKGPYLNAGTSASQHQ